MDRGPWLPPPSRPCTSRKDRQFSGRSRCGLFQNASLNVLVALVKLDEAYPLRLVGRNFRILDPVAAGVLIEIHARIDALVDVIEAEAGRRLSGSGLAGSKSTKAAHSHQKQKDG